MDSRIDDGAQHQNVNQVHEGCRVELDVSEKVHPNASGVLGPPTKAGDPTHRTPAFSCNCDTSRAQLGGTGG